RRVDVAVRAVLRRRGASPAQHPRCSRRPRARPRPALPARARGSGGARARERGDDELHRARRPPAAYAEDEARVELERANEVMTNFIALAAHELRTPMTTIHGFVTTLHHLGERLDPDQRETVRNALLQQTARMAQLIEQLLDLSRLDARAIEISPERIDVRKQVEEIVSTAAPDPSAVEIDVPE